MVFALGSVFIGSAAAFSAFSYLEAVCRALEAIHQIEDAKEQTEDCLKRPGPLTKESGKQGSERLAGWIENTGRLDYIVRKRLHDGSEFTLYLLCDIICLLVSMALSVVSATTPSIWVPTSIFLGFVVVHAGYQEVRYRPWVLWTLKMHLSARRNV